jgi:hypothetical protein
MRWGLLPPLASNEEALLKAQELFSQGDYLPAAQICENVAREGIGQGVRQGPRLLILAGRGYLLAGEREKGMACYRDAFSTMARNGRWFGLNIVSRQAIKQLIEDGFQSEADELSTYTNAIPSAQRSTIENSPRVQLPTNCPSCGAPIRSDQVDWVDQATAECPYCGSLVRGE